MNPLRVALDYQIFSLQSYGGISRCMLSMFEAMACESDIDFSLLAFTYSNEHVKEKVENSMTSWYLPRLTKGERLRYLFNDMATHYWIRRHSPKVIHETYYLRDHPWTPKVKTVITIHDLTMEKFPQYSLGQTGMLEKKRKAIEYADHIVCISQCTRNDLLEFYELDAAKVSVIYHGSPTIKLPIESLDRIIERPYLLYVGARGGYKNFSRLVEAFRSAPRLMRDFSLVCFGGGRLLADEYMGLSTSQIHWVPGDDSLLPNLYKHASAFVYPSLYEGFGLPLLEAMELGCPVVCSNTSAFPEVVGKAAAMFDPTDVESIRSALEGVLFDDGYQTILAEAGLARAQLFTWRNSAKKHAEVYKSIT